MHLADAYKSFESKRRRSGILTFQRASKDIDMQRGTLEAPFPQRPMPCNQGGLALELASSRKVAFLLPLIVEGMWYL